MTDKELIKQEIKKRKQLIWPTNTGEMCVVDTPKPLVQGWLNALDWVLNIINSLPEEYNNDLEEAASKYVREDFHERSRADFKAGAEWTDQHPRKRLLDAEKVIEWLKSNSSKYMIEDIDFSYYAYSSLVEDLRKAMGKEL